MKGDSILDIRHLSKTFGTNLVLKDIDFSVNSGDVTCIIGASGSGKSTLLRCLNLLEIPTTGEIVYHGTNIADKKINAPQYRSKVGMVFQNFNLFNNMTVLDNCMIGQTKVLKKSKAEAQKNAMSYLEKVGMAPYINAKPRQLSGGQKQRVAIARALATNPKVLLCDEATSALDPNTTKSILALLKEINQSMGITVIVITHEMTVIEAICDRVAIIDQSHIAEVGSVSEIFSEPKSKIGRQLILGDAVNSVEFGKSRQIRIIFDGRESAEPVISNLVLACKVPVNIMYAATKDLNGTAVGQMIIQLPEEEMDAKRVIHYLNTVRIPYEECSLPEGGEDREEVTEDGI